MIYYIIIIILVALYRIPRKPYCMIASFMLFLLAGLRANNIGADTEQYYFTFNTISKMSFRQMIASWYMDDKAAEIGYYILNFFAGKLFDYQSFKMLAAAMTIFPAGYVIYRYSNHPWISFLVFFSLPIYTLLSMSALRQGIAFGFIMISFTFIMKRKLLLFFMFVFLAVLFHTSAIFFTPFYFIYSLKYKRQYNFIILLSFFILAMNSVAVFNYLNQYSRINYSVGEAGGWGMLVFLIALLLTSYLISERWFRIKNNIMLFYFVVGTVLFWIIGMNLAAVFRLAAYTEFFICLYASNVLFNIRDRLSRYAVITVACIISLAMMTQLVVRVDKERNGFYPYYFYWEK